MLLLLLPLLPPLLLLLLPSPRIHFQLRGLT